MIYESIQEREKKRSHILHAADGRIAHGLQFSGIVYGSTDLGTDFVVCCAGDRYFFFRISRQQFHRHKYGGQCIIGAD